NKAGALLIVMEIALTLAIACNAAFIVGQLTASISRPTGIDEAHIFSVDNQWLRQGSTPLTAGDLKSRLTTDLAALRRLPGVVDATAASTVPLNNDTIALDAATQPNLSKGNIPVLPVLVDDHALQTFGLKLIAGRWFKPDELVDANPDNPFAPTPAAVVTRAAADALFPSGGAVGKTFYLSDKPVTIVGEVQRMEGSSTGIGHVAEAFNARVVLMPERTLFSSYRYVVRTRPGRMAAAMAATRRTLLGISRDRILTRLQPFAATRADAYRDFGAAARLLAGISVMLLLVTAFGIVGLTSFWVAQRRRQIGVRRALGARRRDIVSYFLTENLLITITGAVLGAALAVGSNLLLTTAFETARMPVYYPAVAVLALLGLGQFAALWPALRAARVPPVVATRTV
ncbi:MAG: ABC transporter permease, partial [Gammaproteobacteria bacterium]|nr:ABC transporter permease [Gammaproteobacteria bacterium]